MGPQRLAYRRLALFVISLAGTAAGDAGAIDCQQMLKGFLIPNYEHASIYVTMVSLNTSAVASYAATRLYYLDPSPPSHGIVFPGRFKIIKGSAFAI